MLRPQAESELSLHSSLHPTPTPPRLLRIFTIFAYSEGSENGDEPVSERFLLWLLFNGMKFSKIHRKPTKV